MKKSLVYLIIAICFGIVFLTLASGVAPVKFDVKTGDTAPNDIYATREVVDRVTTEKQREVAATAVEKQYALDNDVTLSADRELANIFLDIANARQDDEPLDEYEYCFKLTEQEFRDFRERITTIQQEIMNEGVSDVDESMEKIRETIRARTQSEAATVAGVEILQKTLAVNKKISEEKTNEAINAAKAAIPEVVYKQNQVIVRKGDLVNEAQFAVLSDLGLIKGKQTSGILRIVGSLVFTFISFLCIYLYISCNKDKEKYPQTYPVLISIITTVTILLTYFNKSNLINIHVIPIAAGAILLGILIEPKVAMFIHTVICAGATLCMNGDMYYFAAVLVSGYLYIYIYSNISQRSKLVIASCQCAAIGAIVFFTTGLLHGYDTQNSLRLLWYGAVNSVLSSVIVMGVLPFLETFFDAITPFRLLELSNPANPLLSRLLKEASGTYHHSLRVGNLAEAACEAVGGNALLARVGAYYHDAGKLVNPEMFTENQYGDNPHDFIAPEESARVIIAHVRDGADIISQYKLPKAIKQIAASHHGTTSVKYFLYKAEQMGKEVNKKDFCYKGPVPKNKEEAIIMFADSVEAAVTSLDDKSEENIRNMIKKIIESKISEGQLQKCPLTFEEMSKIEDSFMKVFSGSFHSRVKYPDKKSEDNNENGNN